MNRTKSLKGACQHCGAALEYPAENVGTTASCPHCGEVTELLLETPAQEPTIPVRVIVWTAVAVLMLIAGLVGALYALNKTKSLVRERQVPAAASDTNSSQGR